MATKASKLQKLQKETEKVTEKETLTIRNTTTVSSSFSLFVTSKRRC